MYIIILEFYVAHVWPQSVCVLCFTWNKSWKQNNTECVTVDKRYRVMFQWFASFISTGTVHSDQHQRWPCFYCTTSYPVPPYCGLTQDKTPTRYLLFQSQPLLRPMRCNRTCLLPRRNFGELLSLLSADGGEAAGSNRSCPIIASVTVTTGQPPPARFAFRPRLSGYTDPELAPVPPRWRNAGWVAGSIQ